MSRKKFICLDCKVDTSKSHELYMLQDETWNLTGLSKAGMLCVGCTEKRIGRELKPQDFNNSYLNNFRTASKSARLMKRMKG
jgi:hypothetical protein